MPDIETMKIDQAFTIVKNNKTATGYEILPEMFEQGSTELKNLETCSISAY